MSSDDVIRVPVDNDPNFRTKVIPALVRLHEKTVGPVPHGKGGEPSAAHVIRWGCAEAAKPRERSVVLNTQELDAERAKSAALDAKLTDLARECMYSHERRIELEERVAASDATIALLKAGLESRTAAAVDPNESKARRFVPVANDGASLRAAREAANMSQQDLATALGYKDRSAVSLAERGRAPLSASMVKWLEGRPR